MKGWYRDLQGKWSLAGQKVVSEQQIRDEDGNLLWSQGPTCERWG